MSRHDFANSVVGYDENWPLQKRLRSHVPESARHGPTNCETDLLEAADVIEEQEKAIFALRERLLWGY